MAKIKLENDLVVVYYSEVGGGLYDIVKNYKIDLTNRKHYFLKGTEEQEIEWHFKKNEEIIMIDNLKKEVWFKVENCYNVIVTYRKSGNTAQVEKHEKHLENNKIVLEFLKNYTV
jgi:hypothetical protein